MTNLLVFAQDLFPARTKVTRIGVNGKAKCAGRGHETWISFLLINSVTFHMKTGIPKWTTLSNSIGKKGTSAPEVGKDQLLRRRQRLTKFALASAKSTRECHI